MEINYWAILVSGVVAMVIGSIWYGPLFGKKFMDAMGMNEWSPEKQAEMKKGMVKSYVGQFIASLLMFFVLAWYMNSQASSFTGIAGGLDNAFWLWLGFVVPVKLGDALWGGKMSLFWLGVGNMLITLLAAGAIIGAWQ